MTETSLSTNERRFLSLVLILILVFVGGDLFSDSAEGVKWSHLVLELIVAIGAAAGFFVLMKNSFRQSRQLVLSRESIREREKEVERWRLESQKYIQGLSLAIDAQLVRWNLSPSEKEVALLLLKGLSLKEIAQIRETAEKTVRAIRRHLLKVRPGGTLGVVRVFLRRSFGISLVLSTEELFASLRIGFWR